MVPRADCACELDLDCFNGSETGLYEQLKLAFVALRDCMIDHKKCLENIWAAVFTPAEQTLRYDERHAKYVLLKFRPLGKVSLCVRTNTRRGRYSMGKLDANALRRGGARCARGSASVQIPINFRNSRRLLAPPSGVSTQY